MALRTDTPDLPGAIERCQRWVDSQDVPLGYGEAGLDILYDDVALLLAHVVRPEPVEDGEGLLRDAAKLFRFYEQSHLAKGTLEGDSKAARNRWIAERIEAFLARATPSRKLGDPLVAEKVSEATLNDIIRDFTDRARECQTNLDAFDPKAAAVWTFAAEVVREKRDAL